MKTPMKVLIVILVTLVSLLCIGMGIASMGLEGIVFIAVGALILLALILWPLVRKTSSPFLSRVSLSGETIAIIIVGVLLYATLALAIVFAAAGQSLAQTTFLGEVIEVCLGISGVLLLLGGLLLALYPGYQEIKEGKQGVYVTSGSLILFTLLAYPIWETMETYHPECSTAYVILLALTAIGLLIVNTILISVVKEIPWTGRIWRGLLVIPYPIFSSLWAMSLGQATLMYLSDPAQSIWLKIIIGIANLVYVIACLLLSIIVTVQLASEETQKT